DRGLLCRTKHGFCRWPNIASPGPDRPDSLSGSASLGITMSNKLRWGILGVAKINERLLPGFAKANNAELVGIASRSLERAKDAAKAAGIPKAFGSYEALLDDPGIDAVYNPLPNTLHDEWTFRVAVAVLFPEPATATATAPRSARPPALLQRQPRRRLRVEPVRAREGASPVRGGGPDEAP